MARTLRVLTVLAGLAVLTGCGADRDEVPTRIEPAAAPLPRAKPVALDVAEIRGLGQVLTDQGGRTLYLFTQDSKAPSLSTCLDECARKWPPLLVTGDVDVTGVEQNMVTVGGWPVHTFTKDTAPGQTTGHGASGVWFVIEPEGCRSRAPVSQQPTPEGPDGSTGY